MKTIAIIGAGPAGLMSAVTLLENSGNENLHIDIYEKNPSPGKKLLLSGGGRCNVTTGITDKKILESKYTRGWGFIKKALGKFGPKKCYEWFEEHGLRLKIESDNRVFPISDDASEVLEVFDSIFAKYRDNISFHYGEGITGISKNREKFVLHTEKNTYSYDILVLASGGNAYAHTGSTGDGYAFARELGHTISPLGPSLSSFLTKENWTHDLSGVAFENANIDTLNGPLLLTHFGISGPLAFMYSSQIAWEIIEKNTPTVIQLSPLNSMKLEDWESFLKGEFSKHPKKLIASILSEKLPRRFVDAFVTEFFSHISDTFVSSISRTERERISDLLGNGISITLIGRRPGDEFVTAGGVITDEIDPETMESKIQKNLYFAGEILNVDGYTGGFSLQICWSSGYVAGKEISKLLK